MNFGPEVVVPVLAVALAFTLATVGRAWRAGHRGWALAMVVTLAGAAPLLAICYRLRHPRPSLS